VQDNRDSTAPDEERQPEESKADKLLARTDLRDHVQAAWRRARKWTIRALAGTFALPIMAIAESRLSWIIFETWQFLGLMGGALVGSVTLWIVAARALRDARRAGRALAAFHVGQLESGPP